MAPGETAWPTEEAEPGTEYPASTETSSQSSWPSACANTELVPSAGNSSEVVEATLCLINLQRRQAGVPALDASLPLERAAQSYSDSMVADNFFSDTSPGGADVSTRVLETNYVPPGAGYALGENVGYGTGYLSTPAEMVAAWMASPPHRANILDPEFEDTGVGINPAAPRSSENGPLPGATYTEVFGAIVK
jgi:uncharacterized protein YkwD